MQKPQSNRKVWNMGHGQAQRDPPTAAPKGSAGPRELALVGVSLSFVLVYYINIFCLMIIFFAILSQNRMENTIL